MNYYEKKEGLLSALRKHEEARILFECLPRSPAVWDNTDDFDDDEYEIEEALKERGLLACSGGFHTTTEEGRQALIAYINGKEEQDNGEGDEDEG